MTDESATGTGRMEFDDSSMYWWWILAAVAYVTAQFVHEAIYVG